MERGYGPVCYKKTLKEQEELEQEAMGIYKTPKDFYSPSIVEKLKN
jgi:hypothetical protein